MFSTVIAIVACVSVCAVAVVDKSNGFVYPGFGGPSDLETDAWQVGSMRPIQWYTNIQTYQITLWQMNPPKQIATVWETPSEGTTSDNVTFDWQVNSLGADLAASSKFILWGGWEIYKNASSGFTSYSFHISNSDAPSSATSTVTSSSTTPDASATGTSPSASAATPSPTGQSSRTKNESLKIGLGVGLGLGLGLLILAGAWFGRGGLKKCLTRDKKPWTGGGVYGAHNYGSPVGHPQYGDAVKHQAELSTGGPETNLPKADSALVNGPVELSADRPPQEM